MPALLKRDVAAGNVLSEPVMIWIGGGDERCVSAFRLVSCPGNKFGISVSNPGIPEDGVFRPGSTGSLPDRMLGGKWCRTKSILEMNL
jgi:hypothetical protein